MPDNCISYMQNMQVCLKNQYSCFNTSDTPENVVQIEYPGSLSKMPISLCCNISPKAASEHINDVAQLN